MSIAGYLQEHGRKTAVISFGASLHEPDYSAYRASGGRLMMGDAVIGADFSEGRLRAVFTENLGTFPLEADTFVIATGKFMSKGLVADMDKVFEPALGLDVRYDSDRSQWFAPDFSDRQRFLDFGVIVDEQYHPLKGGVAIGNLFAAGEIIEGMYGTSEDSLEKIREQAMEVAGMIAG